MQGGPIIVSNTPSHEEKIAFTVETPHTLEA
jgi:hypothetical protein